MKQGDVVRRTGEDHNAYGDKWVRTGGEYTVSRVKTNRDLCLEGFVSTYGFSHSKFELKLKFKEGDRVTKARVYNPGTYCFWGGDEETVPLGTRGTVNSVSGDDVNVYFDDVDKTWTLRQREIDLISITEGQSERNNSMNSVIAKLFAKDTTENACLVDKHLGTQISTSTKDLSFIILDGKQKALLDSAKEKEAVEKARLEK